VPIADAALAPRLDLKGEAATPRMAPATARAASASPGEDRRLVCGRCRHPICHHEDQIAVEGSLAHTRANALGVVYHFGCFARADGSRVEGIPTLQDTWFAGCAWQYALCGDCGTHLGWYFSGAGSFFGLVLERLTDASSRV
jgi:hypothetical protein